MKKITLLLLFIPFVCTAQFVTQGICTQTGGTFTLNGISQSPYAGRVFSTTAFNLNNNFDLHFNAYMGNIYNNGMAFLFKPGTVPTATNPPTVINTDNIHNFGTGSIATDFVIEFDIRGSFCAAGQNTSYEPLTDINHVAYWKNNSPCNFSNYYSAYSALGTINYYVWEPYRIKWTKSTNTLETYYNNVLIKSNIIDLVALLGTSVYWGFSTGCYCVTGGAAIKDLYLNGVWLLPNNLLSFAAEKNNNGVKLNWQTDKEINSSHYIVEKSTDGRNFYFMDKINASGNSTTLKNYTAYDTRALYGNNFYRLKMVDIDGQFSYSNIVLVKNTDGVKQLTVFPNPVDNELQVQVPNGIKEEAVLQVQDISGKILRQQTLPLNGMVTYTSVVTNGLSKGIYLLVVLHNGSKETVKFIKQ